MIYDNHAARIVNILNEVPFPKQLILLAEARKLILGDEMADNVITVQDVFEIDRLRRKRHELYFQLVNYEASAKNRKSNIKFQRISLQLNTVGKQLYKLTKNPIYYPKRG